MDIFSADKLELFILFVIPGFIAMKVYDLLLSTNHKNGTEQIVDAVAYSCLNYGILSIPIYFVEKINIQASYPFLYGLFYFFVLLVSPIIIVYLWSKLRTANWLQRYIPHPMQKPWDFVFSQRKTYWIIVTLKNGDKVGGKYGLNSFASSAPAEEQIYLEELWLLNNEGGFERAVEQSAGIVILASEIRSVEFMYDGIS